MQEQSGIDVRLKRSNWNFVLVDLWTREDQWGHPGLTAILYDYVSGIGGPGA